MVSGVPTFVSVVTDEPTLGNGISVPENTEQFSAVCAWLSASKRGDTFGEMPPNVFICTSAMRTP
jgi:hypothetical protein